MHHADVHDQADKFNLQKYPLKNHKLIAPYIVDIYLVMSAITWAQTTLWLKTNGFVYRNNKLQFKNKQTNKQTNKQHT